jgi:hypothetical protein
MPTSVPTRRRTEVAATTSTEIDEFAEKFEEEFSLVASLSSSSVAELEELGHGSWTVDHLAI